MSDLIYTTIQHVPRKKWGLTMNEYCICDIVYHLSNNPKYQWCIKSKESFAQDLGLSKQSVLSLIQKMIDKGLVEKDEETKHLKTTKLWYNEFVTIGKESLPVVKKDDHDGKESLPDPVKKVYHDGKESLPNNNIIYIDNKNINKFFQDFRLLLPSPMKEGKDLARRNFEKKIKTQEDYDRLVKGLQGYIAVVKQKSSASFSRPYKQGGTFMNQDIWMDYQDDEVLKGLQTSEPPEKVYNNYLQDVREKEVKRKEYCNNYTMEYMLQAQTQYNKKQSNLFITNI